MMKNNIKKIIISLITNPILLISYWIFLYGLASLCMNGINNIIYILFIGIILIILIAIYTINKIVKYKEAPISKSIKGVISLEYLSVIIFIALTLFYGFSIYKSLIR